VRSIAICLAVAVAAAGWGCGQSDEDQVRQTLQAFGQAVAAKDSERLCKDLLAKELLDRLAQAGVPCNVALSRGLAGASQPRLRVLKVDVRSDRLAYAMVRTDAANQQPSTDTFRVLKERGRWRVGSLAGGQPNAPSAPGGP
jgi:hypothetical protein